MQRPFLHDRVHEASRPRSEQSPPTLRSSADFEGMLLPRLKCISICRAGASAATSEVNQVLQILLMSDAWMKAFAEAGMLCGWKGCSTCIFIKACSHLFARKRGRVGSQTQHFEMGRLSSGRRVRCRRPAARYAKRHQAEGRRTGALSLARSRVLAVGECASFQFPPPQPLNP